MVSIKNYNTLSIDSEVRAIKEFFSLEELIGFLSSDNSSDKFSILGEGSNVLIGCSSERDFYINRIKGIQVEDHDDFVILTIGAGEFWADVVKYAVSKSYYGIENLACIPGCVGAASIQNIGAFGVEFKDVCVDVRYYDPDLKDVFKFTNLECDFGYRDSIFKREKNKNLVVVSTRIKLSKVRQFNISYFNSQRFDLDKLTLDEMYYTIYDTRMLKIPDPKKIANSGSFFKNPTVSESKYNEILLINPNLVGFKLENGYKISAGWLIDNIGLKGVNVGDAVVCQKNALVIGNLGTASYEQVATLAKMIQKSVFEWCGVTLIPEVVYID